MLQSSFMLCETIFYGAFKQVAPEIIFTQRIAPAIITFVTLNLQVKYYVGIRV